MKFKEKGRRCWVGDKRKEISSATNKFYSKTSLKLGGRETSLAKYITLIKKNKNEIKVNIKKIFWEVGTSLLPLATIILLLGSNMKIT